MSPEAVFRVVNLLALAGWIALIVLPRRRVATTILPIAIPVALGAVYAVLAAISLPTSDGGFSSLASVHTLFQDPNALLAGWVHYLAFDLFLGGWQARDAQRRGVPHLLIVPSLILTFLVGPVGLLLYLAIRQLRGRAAASSLE